MTGFVIGSPDEKVTAYFHNETDFRLVIYQKNDTIYVDPAWYYTDDPDARTKYYIYRESQYANVDSGNSPSNDSWCGAITYQDEESGLPSPDNVVTDGIGTLLRNKRQADHVEPPQIKTRCRLKLVSDYKFFQSFESSSIWDKGDPKYITNLSRLIQSYIIERILGINRIFLRTVFGSNVNMGFTIGSIDIHSEYSDDNSPSLHYNEDLGTEDPFGYEQLLKVFSRPDYSDFCLAHLFTHQRFGGEGVLGLAYVGTPTRSRAGGICSSSISSATQKSVNTGWTTSMDKRGNRITTRQATLVTAHELGHNWGANHDNTTCSPSSTSGGKYIMYPFSVSGNEPNNNVFSPCSKVSIGFVLDGKKDACFTENIGSYCGNGVVEEESDEECDPPHQSSHCCDEDTCKFKMYNGKKANCTFNSDVCCNEFCDFERAGRKCANGDEQQCQKEFRCTGESSRCDRAMPVDDGTKCGYSTTNECRFNKDADVSECLSLCKQNDMYDCECGEEDNYCAICCLDERTKTCSPYKEKPSSPLTYLPEGASCPTGFCLPNNRCSKEVRTTVERWWNYIQDIHINNLAEVMRDNLVGVTIILSLVLWIPISIVIYCIDKRNADDSEKSNLERSSGNVPQIINSSVYRHGALSSGGTAAGGFAPHQPTTSTASGVWLPSPTAPHPRSDSFHNPQRPDHFRLSRDVAF